MKKYKLIIYFLILVIHSVLYAQMGNIDLDNMTLEEVTQKIQIETNKENLAGWYSLRAMMYYAKTNDIDKAMKDIDKALELYPLAVFYSVKGEFYYNLEDYKRCIEYVDKALESNLTLSFKPASAYYTKGLALYKLLEYEKAIESKKVAEQSVEKARAEQEKLKVEAENRVRLAEYSLQEKELQAKANAVESNSLTPQLLRKMAIEKWDGKLPQVQGNNGSTLINLD